MSLFHVVSVWRESVSHSHPPPVKLCVSCEVAVDDERHSDSDQVLVLSPTVESLALPSATFQFILASTTVQCSGYLDFYSNSLQWIYILQSYRHLSRDSHSSAREMRDSPGQVKISLWQYYVYKYERAGSISCEPSAISVSIKKLSSPAQRHFLLPITSFSLAGYRPVPWDTGQSDSLHITPHTAQYCR